MVRMANKLFVTHITFVFSVVLTPSFMHVNILPSRKTLPTDVAKVGLHNYPKTILTIRIMTL